MATVFFIFFFLFWCYFNLVKLVKFGVSGHFLVNSWKGLKFCLLMYHDHLQNWLDYGYSLLIFLIYMSFWLSETHQIWCFQAFWLCSVDFPHYGDPFGEIGHIWDFWALSGERVGVKVRCWRRHISNALRRVLSSYNQIYPQYHHFKTDIPNRHWYTFWANFQETVICSMSAMLFRLLNA